MTDQRTLPTTTDVEGFAQADYYLKLEGVEGELARRAREAAGSPSLSPRPGVEVLSFSWGISRR